MDFTKFHLRKHSLARPNVCNIFYEVGTVLVIGDTEVNGQKNLSFCRVYSPGEERDIRYIISNSLIYLLKTIYWSSIMCQVLFYAMGI